MEYIDNKLLYLHKNKLLRECQWLESEQAPKVSINEQIVLLFGSNNYLGLCNDQRLKQAAINAIEKYGVGAGGSRLTTGSYRLHQQLEEKIAKFKGTEASLVFNNGYVTNVGIISSLCNSQWVIFSDKYNHASIVDGCLLSGAKLVRYKHCDINDLEKKINKFKGQYNLIVTDAVFSMDGDIAPIQDIVNLAKKHNMVTMIDDAHGVGVLGKDGSGTLSHLNIASEEVDIQVGTLSKAVGSVGGYIAGKKTYIKYFNNLARSFMFSTALPPASLAVSLKALEIIKNSQNRREQLLKNSTWLKNQLLQLGYTITNTETPIIPVIIGEADMTIKLNKHLLSEGIYIPAIRQPTVPKGTSRLRISLMATHTKEDLTQLLNTLHRYGKQLGII